MSKTSDYVSNRNKPEYIICAAIHFNDGVAREQQPYNVPFGFVIAGRRHHNCYATAFLLHGDTAYKQHENIQGFLTSKDRFVDRREGGKIALANGQIEKETDVLFSEDLY